MTHDPTSTPPGRAGSDSGSLLGLVEADLEEMKAGDIEILDVRELTDLTDYMVVATGRTERHVRAIAEKVALAAKHRGAPALGLEGEREGEWVLVDLCDVVVHVMQPETRDLYQLERLWAPVAEARNRTKAP